MGHSEITGHPQPLINDDPILALIQAHVLLSLPAAVGTEVHIKRALGHGIS